MNGENPTPGSEIEQVSIAYPKEQDLHLRITVGACRLRIVPGEGDSWVEVTYSDPSHLLPIRISAEGGTLRISQAYDWSRVFDLPGRVPRLDLAIGKAKPFVLTLESGASENEVDLGGEPIKRLAIKHGAGRMVVDFSAPDPQPMSLLSVEAGAGSLELRNAANANFAEMSASGGAAAFKLDFGGELQRNAHVRISTGVSSVEVRIPSTTAAKIATQTVMGSVNVGDGFSKKEGTFQTAGAFSGTTAPVLLVDASVALGSLILRAT